MADFQDLQLTTPPLSEPSRLDYFLAGCVPLSRRQIRHAIDEGGVYVNKKRCRKAGKLLHGGEKVRFLIPAEHTNCVSIFHI